MTNSAEQLIFHAATLLEEGNPAGAIETLHEAIELSSIVSRRLELLRAKFMLAEILTETGKTEEAVEQYEDVILLGEDFPEPELVDEEIAASRTRLETLLPPDEPHV